MSTSMRLEFVLDILLVMTTRQANTRWKNSKKIKMRLIKTAIPSVKLGPDQEETVISDRELRHRRRERQSLDNEMEAKRNDDIVISEIHIDTEDDHGHEQYENTQQMLEEKLHEKEEIIKRLRAKVKALKGKVRTLNRRKHPKMTDSKKKDMIRSFLRKNLNWTNQQAIKAFNKSQTRWSSEDIVLGLTLRAMSSRAYQFLRQKKVLPLPSMSTLRKHIKHFTCSPGILEEIFQMISRQREVLGDGSDKPIATALCFDEMALHKDIQFDQAEEKMYGPHKEVQVVMIRGLFKNFKQPIFYDFDKTMTRDILFTLIEKLDGIGFQVECVTSDMGPKNIGLWKELDIHTEKPHFDYNGRQIQVFADVPHLLKLLRNHFLDQGFLLKDGTLILKEDIQKLLTVNSGEKRLAYKLAPRHFECSGSLRQNVALAAQLFSRSTARAIRLIFPDKIGLADFVELINDTFDIMNSRSAEGHAQYDYALGWESEFKKMVTQQEILMNAKEVIGGMRTIDNKLYKEKGIVKPKQGLHPFQKGWIVSITAALDLVEKLRKKYGAKFLMTARANQDHLEVTFSRVRYIGGPNTHPGCVEFKNRLRLLVLGDSSEFIVTGCPVQAELEEEIMLSQQLVEGIETERPEDLIIDEVDIGAQESVETTSSSEIDCNAEINKYLAGYIAFKFKNEYPEMSEEGTVDKPISCPWIEAYSYGGLTKPSRTWYESYLKLDAEFHNLHGMGLSKESRIIQKATQHITNSCSDIPEDVIKFFAKMRTHIRIKFLRRQFKTSSEEKRPPKKLKHNTT